ncbi:acetamidase/formamidase family protein, partial [Singulisphaera rosea]
MVSRCLLLVWCLCTPLVAQDRVDESWVVKTDLWGNPLYQILTLHRDGGQLTGEIGGDSLEGHLDGDVIEFVSMNAGMLKSEYRGKRDGSLSGTVVAPDPNHPDVRVTHTFTARMIPLRPDGPPRRHEFKPTDYSNEFTPHRLPILTIWPGDAVHTTTVDSGGVDEKGVTRALFGNPQTGPFFVGGARPSDTLAVRIVRLRLNRDYADSLDDIVG